MKIGLCYSLPIQTEENWFLFKEDVQRFIDRWWLFPPAIDCTLFAVGLGNEVPNEIRAMFLGLPVEFPSLKTSFIGGGADAAAAVWLAKELDGWFMISMGARVSFHRKGAVKEMVMARFGYGPCLFGSSCSREATSHIRPSFYGLDANFLRFYPERIASPSDGTAFEIGPRSLLKWTESIGLPSLMVYWCGVFPNKEDWFSQPNTFRDGDQTNLLVWDKQTDLYQNSDDQFRGHLHELAFGLANPVCPS